AGNRRDGSRGTRRHRSRRTSARAHRTWRPGRARPEQTAAKKVHIFGAITYPPMTSNRNVAVSSTSMSSNSRLSSPRFRRRLFWIGGAVLVVGVSATVIGVFWPTPKSLQTPPSTRPAQIAPKQKTVALEQGVKEVGEQFIETAVARRNLADSWKLIAPE